MATSGPTRVLVVDESAIVRKLLTNALSGDADIEVAGTAGDPYIARDLILKRRPDVLTLDIEMPRMDGLTFLSRLMEHYPLPVIIVSSLTQTGSAATIEALRLGAVDVIPKPDGPHSVGQIAAVLKRRIREIARHPRVRLQRLAPPAAATPGVDVGRLRGLLAVGASTGGTQAIEAVLTRLPANVPPVVIVQHMPATFTRAFAARLDTVCPMRVVEAQGGETLEHGVAYIAPGDRHLVVERHGLTLRTALRDGPPVHFQRPAVDILFHSVARLTGVPTVGLLLTGMGADGADGMVALKKSGAETIAEDEQSCVVFGMPKEAISRGGACQVATLLDIPRRVVEAFVRHNRPSPSEQRS
jgi:two-component system chemotaxis response regulator CheB